MTHTHSNSFTSKLLPHFITIIDDNEYTARDIKQQVEDITGFSTRVITRGHGHYNKVEDLLDQIDIGQTSVLCDHRLRSHGLARFNGAEFVAVCNEKSIPAILMSQFIDQDGDSSIRRHRRHVPVLLSRHQITPDVIKAGLHTCWNELQGHVLPTRISYRSQVEIVELSDEGGEEVADAFVPGWKPDVSVRFPLSLIERSLRQLVKDFFGKQSQNDVQPFYLYAGVNIGAEYSNDIFFENFENPTTPEGSLIDDLTERWIIGTL